MEELVKNLAKEHMVWSGQAVEILHVFKNIEQFVGVAVFLMQRCMDRHNRFTVV